MSMSYQLMLISQEVPSDATEQEKPQDQRKGATKMSCRCGILWIACVELSWEVVGV